MEKTKFSFPLILDGAMGTNLLKIGLPVGECPEKWILSSGANSDAVVRLQTEYIARGSRAVLVPTFGANRAVLKKYALSDRTGEINHALVALTKAAIEKSGVSERVFIGGDISTTGIFLKPVGDASFSELKEIFKEQAGYLEDAGADFFFIETQTSLAEAKAAVRAVKEISNKPVFVTMTPDNGFYTMFGTDVRAAMIALWACGAEGFGLNCSRGPEEMRSVFEALVEFCPEDLVLVAKPNAGLPDGKNKEQSPCDFADELIKIADLGVGVLGGCCGTTPEHIFELTNKIKGMNFKNNQGIDASRLACSDRRIFDITKLKTKTRFLPCSEDITDMAEEEAGDILCVDIPSPDEAENLCTAVNLYDRPIEIRGDFISLEAALSQYPGRLILNTEGLTDTQKEELVKKHNPVL